MRMIARVLTLVAVVLAAPASAATTFSKLFVFGDSLVDSGNAHIATFGTEAPAIDGYFAGRFSNGPNFADYLSLALVGTPATPALLGGNNIAVGGSTAELIPGAASPSFLEQIGLYNSLVGQPIPSDALVLVTFGGNDVRRTILTGGTVDFSGAVSDFATGLNLLYAGGARNFLITGSADIGLLPRSVADAGAIPDRLAELSARSQQISTLFANTSAAFAGMSDAEVTYFDLFSFEHAVRANPTAFGLPANLDTTTPCQLSGAGPLQPVSCGFSLYFDAIHPTTIAHQALAGGILARLDESAAAIPEPATWLLMILGFGFVGARLRTRRSKALAAG